MDQKTFSLVAGLIFGMVALFIIYVSIFVTIQAFGFAWWLRNHISKERIAALEERLRLGKQGRRQ